MSNVVRPPFVVCVPHPDGERFLIVRPDTMIARTFPPKPGERWPEAVQRFFRNEPQLTEADLRARLTDMGLDERAATEQIHRARRLREFNDLSSWDHITSIGFRNREGQTVVRKTDRQGNSPEQRVFVLRCTVCGHEYGAEGSEIYGRLCPRCQDGPPGLPT
jgi:hypothetical protein